MVQHDFTILFAAYPKVITSLPSEFTSHEFVLRLAQCEQVAYIDSLHAYRHSHHGSNPAPFKAVHAILAKHLREHPTLATFMKNVRSKDIFGQTSACARWKTL